jgi:hypothetical protein
MLGSRALKERGESGVVDGVAADLRDISDNESYKNHLLGKDICMNLNKLIITSNTSKPGISDSVSIVSESMHSSSLEPSDSFKILSRLRCCAKSNQKNSSLFKIIIHIIINNDIKLLNYYLYLQIPHTKQLLS